MALKIMTGVYTGGACLAGIVFEDWVISVLFVALAVTCAWLASPHTN